MTEMTNTSYYCSELSTQADEQLFATASRVNVWLLLEQAGPWTKKPLDDSSVPPAVKQRLNTAARAIPHARLQMIKQQPHAGAQAAFYVAVSNELRPVLYKFDLTTYNDLLGIDIGAVAAGDPRYEDAVIEDPLALVCTHGAHDRCCGRLGLPVFAQMAGRSDITAWQTTHVGGHRFAANMVFLPHGVYYGRAGVPDLNALVSGYSERRLVLNHYRGRSCYDAEVQAAEYFLRAEKQLLDLDGLRFLQLKTQGGNVSVVEFMDTAGGARHAVHIAREANAIHTYTSCGASERAGIDQYRLLAIA
jgi:hypothetical protein